MLMKKMLLLTSIATLLAGCSSSNSGGTAGTSGYTELTPMPQQGLGAQALIQPASAQGSAQPGYSMGQGASSTTMQTSSTTMQTTTGSGQSFVLQPGQKLIITTGP
jgi:hypothetical protein